MWDGLFARGSWVLPGRLRVRTPGQRMHKLAEVLPANGIEEVYFILRSHWKDPGALVLGGVESHSLLTSRSAWPTLGDPVAQMMYLDSMTYLPDDILTKVDRASMAVSLEARVPYLDHRVVALAARIPIALRIRDGVGKWILRQVLYRHVPKALLDRPKAGFGMPIDSWLRGSLRPWAEELLSEDRLRSQGVLDPGPIRTIWSQHVAGYRDFQYQIWDILMLQAWLEESQPSVA